VILLFSDVFQFTAGSRNMGKYLIYGVIIFIALFILNFFQIIHLPFLDVPDYTKSKQEAVHHMDDTLKNVN
jgi:hypothetical protein